MVSAEVSIAGIEILLFRTLGTVRMIGLTPTFSLVGKRPDGCPQKTELELQIYTAPRLGLGWAASWREAIESSNNGQWQSEIRATQGCIHTRNGGALRPIRQNHTFLAAVNMPAHNRPAFLRTADKRSRNRAHRHQCQLCCRVLLSPWLADTVRPQRSNRSRCKMRRCNRGDGSGTSDNKRAPKRRFPR